MAEQVEAAQYNTCVTHAFGAPGTVLLHTTDAVEQKPGVLLFADPSRYIMATDAASLPAAFDEAQCALDAGNYLAGYITYEAGITLQGQPAHPLPTGEPLLCLGVYSNAPERCAAPDHSTDHDQTPELKLALFPAVSREDYDRNIAQIQQWIADGDIYQANYTLPLRSLTNDAPQNLFRTLLQRQPAAYAAVVRLAPPNLSSPTILSFSPELFFRTTADGSILTRPMKGTAARVASASEDAQQAAWLAADPKNRAEHVMIVDLLRNDLGRICEHGSIQTENLFHIRTLPTVHQMVSDVRGQLRAGTSWLQVFQALFPSGSVTGAPKLRAMHLLHQAENAPRGIYTGAIGYIAPSGEACFSVVIRTLVLRPSSTGQEVTCGVGGGIVADSTAAGEYSEALLKAAFVRHAATPLQLIETVRSDGNKVRWIEPHLDRLQRTAAALGLPFQRGQVRDHVIRAAQTPTAGGPRRIRITLSEPNCLHAQNDALEIWPDSLRVRMSPYRTHLGDPALEYKTNFRERYDEESREARQAGFDEAIFTNDAGLITEGCITNIFFVRAGRIFTPYVDCGVLPGILRGQLLRHKLVTESLLPLADLEHCEAVLLGNSLRGVFPVHSLQITPERTLTWDSNACAPYLRHLQQVFAI